MRKYLLVLMLFLSASAFAQAAHKITLTWQDTQNPPGTVYNVYKNVTSGPCTATPTLQTLSASVTAFTFDDTTVKVGETWCYAVTAGTGASESGFSNTAQATVKNFPPQNLGAKGN